MTRNKFRIKAFDGYRPLSILKDLGDLEWLESKRCPACRMRGRLFLHDTSDRCAVGCMNCGHRFRIKGRPV